MKQNNKINLSPRGLQIAKYNNSRANLLLVVVFTVINVVLGLTGSGTYFLFSAFIPYYLVIDSMYLCGKMPDNWYELDKSEYIFYNNSYLIIMLTIAFTVVALYLLFWFLSKKQKSGWLIAALVIFGIDTALFFLIGGFSLDSILDILFHIYVLYYLISGIIAAHKLKKLPLEDENEAEKEGVDYFPKTVELKNGKDIDHIGTTYIFGKQSMDAFMYFYNDRIILKSTPFSVLPDNITFKYSDIAEIKPKKNLWISNGMIIYTSDGTEHHFSLKYRDDIMEFITSKARTFKNSV